MKTNNQVIKINDAQSSMIEEKLTKETGSNEMKMFRSIDLWNIHRQRKILIIR